MPTYQDIFVPTIAPVHIANRHQDKQIEQGERFQSLTLYVLASALWANHDAVALLTTCSVTMHSCTQSARCQEDVFAFAAEQSSDDSNAASNGTRAPLQLLSPMAIPCWFLHLYYAFHARL